MAPPTLVRLYAATSDRKFLDYMNREFEWCQNTLYSDEDKLFYRDADFIGRTSPSGKKIFWSRGNGWVLGGLAQILQFLPKDEPSRKSYENLYTAMAEKVASLQGEDGLWRVNLADPEHYKGGETSGSGFFTYAIAWGINNGLLDRDKYLPIAIKGWKGLLTRVRPDGMVGYVQPVGSAPDSFTKDTTHAYGVGAFLLAGSEIARALGMAAKSIFLSLTRQIIFLIPLLFLLSPHWGLSGVWAAFPISDALAIIVSAILVIYEFRSLRRMELTENKTLQ